MEFSVRANEQVIRILRRVPLVNMAMWEGVKAIIDKFAMTPEEHAAVKWTPIDGMPRSFSFDPTARLERELTGDETAFLLRVIDSPPAGLEWTFETVVVRNEIVTALGGQSWE